MDTSTLTYADLLNEDLELSEVQRATGLKWSHCVKFTTRATQEPTESERYTRAVSVIIGKISEKSQQS